MRLELFPRNMQILVKSVTMCCSSNNKTRQVLKARVVRIHILSASDFSVLKQLIRFYLFRFVLIFLPETATSLATWAKRPSTSLGVTPAILRDKYVRLHQCLSDGKKTEMALIVVLLFLFRSSFAYHVMGKDNLTGKTLLSAAD